MRTPESVNLFYAEHPLKRFENGGKQTEYITAGEGLETVLLFPGGGQTAQSNFALIEALEQRFKVIAPTVYDVGSVGEFCQTIDSLLDHEEVDSVNVYGLSVGGLLAQSYLWRHKERVESVILSHACTSESKRYESKVVRPLRALSVVLPIIPDGLIKSFAKLSAVKIQGVSGENVPRDPIMSEPRNAEVGTYFAHEFYDKYLTKTLLRSWINIHTDFSRNEKLSPSVLKDWPGRVLILRTDNDPLMQDEGYFARLYPNAEVHTFNGTGHVTFYYQFTEMMKVINKFLK
ncbi:alpha/beta hydrolase [Candidatus Woesebacteria bacterium]|nr:alpha/beta hydrolase [Candidatus Woesebacteria bacterium]